MKQLLENEGINIENDKVVNFEKVFWEPKDLEDSNKSNLKLIDE
jgi:methylated-DNA-protein-cysteine methyltransferase-like protein